MYVVILAGGSGTRFWPLSRKKTPKQLMSVFGGKSMLQRTVERVLPLKPKRILVVTNTLQATETRRQLDYLRGVRIEVIEEPLGRNTAPAICLAATIIARYEPEGVMAVLPADHYIRDEDEFAATLLRGADVARNGYLVTLGIAPDRPETGYGYLEAETELRGTGGPYPVKRFIEKPDRQRALEFLAAGTFFWNSGMFLWRADVILDQIAALMPELARAFAGLTFSPDIWEPADLIPQIEAVYTMVDGQSIDYGVMERAANVMMLPAAFGWSDVGSWGAIPDVLDPDGAGNVVIDTETVVIDSHGCVVRGDKLTALVGVTDLVVVDTPDALLVCARERAQEVKQVTEELERRKLGRLL